MTFIQKGGSCVLASYAIVHNYFTGRAIGECFEDYCRHFGLQFTDWRDAELVYPSHFDNEWRARNCRGYEVILDLHRFSRQTAFTEGRKVFNGQFHINSTIVQTQLEKSLRSQEALLNIAYNHPDGDYHSVTVFDSGSGLLERDTNSNDLLPIKGLSYIGTLRDSVLYSAISK